MPNELSDRTDSCMPSAPQANQHFLVTFFPNMFDIRYKFGDHGNETMCMGLEHKQVSRPGVHSLRSSRP